MALITTATVGFALSEDFFASHQAPRALLVVYIAIVVGGCLWRRTSFRIAPHPHLAVLDNLFSDFNYYL